MKVILLMVIGSVFAAALALVRNFPSFLLPDSCIGKLRPIHHAQPRPIEVDCEDRSLQTFFITDNTKIATPTNPHAGLQDLNAGDPITIRFSCKGDAGWAHSIPTMVVVSRHALTFVAIAGGKAVCYNIHLMVATHHTIANDRRLVLGEAVAAPSL